MISTRTVAASVLVVAAATGCAAAHGRAAGGSGVDGGIAPASTSSAGTSSASTSSAGMSSAGQPTTPDRTGTSTAPTPTTSTSPDHAPTPTLTATASEAPSTAPPSDPSPMVNVRAGAADLCTNGSIDLWSYASDAAQNEVSRIALNMRFVPSKGGQELDSAPGMTKDSGVAFRWDRTVKGSDFFGQTGTLHYSATATDRAGHSASTDSKVLPVVVC